MERLARVDFCLRQTSISACVPPLYRAAKAIFRLPHSLWGYLILPRLPQKSRVFPFHPFPKRDRSSKNPEKFFELKFPRLLRSGEKIDYAKSFYLPPVGGPGTHDCICSWACVCICVCFCINDTLWGGGAPVCAYVYGLATNGIATGRISATQVASAMAPRGSFWDFYVAGSDGRSFSASHRSTTKPVPLLSTHRHTFAVVEESSLLYHLQRSHRLL